MQFSGPDGIGRRLNTYDMGELEMQGAWQVSSRGLAINSSGQARMVLPADAALR